MAELIVEMTSEPIELCKLLKIADLVSGGGEAKVVISEGYVSLNGEVEYQKRKKIYHGDVVGFNGDFIEFNVVEALDEPEIDGSAQHFTDANAEDNSPNIDYSPPFQKSNNYKNVENAKSAPTQNKGKPKSNAQPNTKKSTNSAPKQEKSKRRPISF